MTPPPPGDSRPSRPRRCQALKNLELFLETVLKPGTKPPALLATLGLVVVHFTALPGNASAADRKPAAATKADKARSEQKKAKSRTLQEMIELALSSGTDSTLNEAMAEQMGFGEVPMPRKKIQYKASVTSDQRNRGFLVILDRESRKPIALELGSMRAYENDGHIYVDGMVFLASLDGKLKRAFNNKGKAGELESVELSIASRDVKRQFAEELNFHLQKALELGIMPTK